MSTIYGNSVGGSGFGVYIGSGEMPDGYKVQIDPEGEAELITKEAFDNLKQTVDNLDLVPTQDFNNLKQTVDNLDLVPTQDFNNLKQTVDNLDLVSTQDFNNLKQTVTKHSSLLEEITGSIQIDSYEELAELIASGESEKVISPGDELIVNKLTSLNITSSNSSLSFTVIDEQIFSELVGECDYKAYILTYNGSNWIYEGNIVTSDKLGFSIEGTPNTNDTVIVTMNIEEVSHTFVDYTPTGEYATTPVDKNVEKFWIIEQTYIPTSNIYDKEESAICVTVGHTLPAGNYYVYNVPESTSDYWCNYKRLYYLFTVPNDITASEETGDIQLRFSSRGSRETDGDARGVYQLTCIPYRCIDDVKHSEDTITFVGQVSAPDSSYTDIRTISGFSVDQSMESEGIIYNNLGHVCYGNNTWGTCNLKQYLNSDEKNMVPVRLHKNDVVTNLKNVKGFLWGFDPRFKKLIKAMTTFQQYGLDDNHSRYSIYSDVSPKSFLLSMYEMCFNIQTNEGVVTDLYSEYCEGTLNNNAVAGRIKYYKKGSTDTTYRWSRSALAGNPTGSRLVNPSGSNDGNHAVSGHRFAPAYIIGKPKSKI